MENLTDMTTEKRWWPRFFAQLAEHGVITKACQAARISRETVYRTKRECPEFARRWQEAEEIGLSALEDRVMVRAANTSDTLAIFILKCRMPERYQDRRYLTHEGRVGLDLTNLTDDELNSIASGDPDEA